MTRTQVALRLAVLAAVIAAIVVIDVTVGLPSRAGIRAQFDMRGWWVGPAFAGVYALASLSPLPKTVFTLVAGALFGIPAGVFLVILGATVGAVAAFLLSRVVGHEAVARITHVRADRFDDLLTRRGFLAILVARLVPVVPFTALNYVAGLTSVRLRDFLPATVLGIIPATTAYVTIGARGDQPGSWPFLVALGALGLFTAAGLAAAWRRRRQMSNRSTTAAGAPES